MDKNSERVSATADRELFATRILNAPVNLVWKVMTEPEHIKHWWGPNGFTNTIHKMEVKPNGEWDFIMHGPDGTDYKNTNVYEEVTKNKRLVYNHVSPPLHHVTIELEEVGGATKLTWHMVFPTAELRDEVVKKYGAAEGLTQNLNRLGEYLKNINLKLRTINQGTPFTIERTYNATADKVWKAITDKGAMKKWYFDIAEFEPVVGFEFTFEGRNEEMNMTYIHLCKVTEVVTGKKLAYSWRYKGYEGSSLVTIELFAEGNKTRLKLTHSGLETFPDTPAFARTNFEGGWTHIIGKSLKNYLEN